MKVSRMEVNEVRNKSTPYDMFANMYLYVASRWKSTSLYPPMFGMLCTDPSPPVVVEIPSAERGNTAAGPGPML